MNKTSLLIIEIKFKSSFREIKEKPKVFAVLVNEKKLHYQELYKSKR